jgi:hypothetical protein
MIRAEYVDPHWPLTTVQDGKFPKDPFLPGCKEMANPLDFPNVADNQADYFSIFDRNNGELPQ